MRLDQFGRLGIGLIPEDPLHISGGVRPDKANGVINNNYGRLHFNADTTIDYGFRVVHHQGTEGVQDAMISVGGSGSNNKNHIHFYTKGDGSSNSTISASIDNDGNLGIGTTVPNKKLVVQSDTQFDGIKVRNSSRSLIDMGGYNASNDNSFIQMYNSNGNIGSLFKSEGSSYINGGNFGIGTNAPAVKLHVNSGTNNTPAMFESTDAFCAITLGDISGSAAVQTTLGGLRFMVNGDPGTGANNGIEAGRFTSDGNLAVGKTSAAGRLDVKQNSSSTPGTDLWTAFSSDSGQLFGFRNGDSGNEFSMDRKWGGDWYPAITVNRANGRLNVEGQVFAMDSNIKLSEIGSGDNERPYIQTIAPDTVFDDSTAIYVTRGTDTNVRLTYGGNIEAQGVVTASGYSLANLPALP